MFNKNNPLSIILLAICMWSCNDQIQIGNSGQINTKGMISIDGSSTVYPITEAVAEEFRKQAPYIKVIVGVSGTGGGFKKFSRGETGVSNASRPMKRKEAELCKANQIDYIGLPIAIDGLSVIVHPDNDWAEKLTIAELKYIWQPKAQDIIKKWNQIRPEWPNEEIHLFGPGTVSGTYDCFADVVCGEDVGTRGDYTASEDDNMLVQGIARDKNALGFFSLAYYKENTDKLKLVAIDNGEGAVLPTFQSIKNGRYKFLSRYIYIYVTKKAAQNEEIKEFIRFYLAEAGALSAELGYIPLNHEEYKKQRKHFDAFCQKPRP